MIGEISPYQGRTISLEEMQKFAGNIEFMSLFHSRESFESSRRTYTFG